MAHMLIMNPRKRGAKKRKASAAQLAARAKFIAMAKARRKPKVKSNPSKKRRRSKVKARRRSVVKSNPSPAPMKRKNARRRRRSSPRLRFWRRKVRSNPILPRSFMDTHLQPAMIGAVGALANDVAVGYLVNKLPAGLQKPEIRHLVKGVTAIALSMAAAKAKIASGSTLRHATVGALTCVLHDAGRAQAQKMLPTVALGEYLSEVIGPWYGMQSYGPTGIGHAGMGEYLSGTDAIGASDFSSAGNSVVY